MKRVARGVVVALALALAACAAPPPAPSVTPIAASVVPPRIAAGPLPVVNPGFEAEMRSQANCATGWSCTMHGNPKSFRFFHGDGAPGGKQSFCLEPIAKEPWAMVTQGSFDPALRGMRLRFSLSLNLREGVGEGAGIWVHIQRPRAPMGHVEKLVKGSADWQPLSVEFDVADDAQTVEYGVILRGKGRACLDDVRLEVLRPAKNPV